VAQKSGVDVNATGRENLLLQGHLHGMQGSDLERRVGDLLERFGLADSAKRVARTYSGGMQRKLDVAMGLVHMPQVLFLDEPTTGLDPEARADMWAEITRLAEEEGLTILLTTHYLEEADRLARRLAIVDLGRVVAEGTPDELKGELHGDAVHIELSEPEIDGRVAAALVSVTAVNNVTIEDGRLLHAHSDDGAHAVPVILQALDASGIGVLSVTVARPSLDDVYLKYTGRSFTKADAAETGGKR
jgi:ABC-2 type transport system ATP-binding protein